MSEGEVTTTFQQLSIILFNNLGEDTNFRAPAIVVTYFDHWTLGGQLRGVNTMVSALPLTPLRLLNLSQCSSAKTCTDM